MSVINKRIVNQHYLMSQTTEKFIKLTEDIFKGNILYKTRDHRLLDFGEGTEKQIGKKVK